MTAPSKQKARNLERVRLNQQRSRDRKRQYTAELERKVEQLEQRVRHPNTSNDSGLDVKLAKLSHENKIRRDLLCVLGIDAQTQERFLRAALKSQGSRMQPNIAVVKHQDARPSPPTDETHSASPPQAETFKLSPVSMTSFDRGPSAQETQPSLFQTNSPSLLWPPSDALSLLETIHGQMMSSRPEPPPNPTLCSNCSSCTSTTPTIPSFPSDSTTACSLAFSMVVSNNKRGYEFVDLESRMRVGYQKGSTPGEECRILNKVLFAVLAEIT